MLKRNEQQKLITEMARAMEKQNDLVKSLKKATNPQLVKMKHIAKGKVEALEAVLDIMKGHPHYLLKIMGD